MPNARTLMVAALSAMLAACAPDVEPASDERLPDVLTDSVVAPPNPIEQGSAPARQMAEQADSAMRERERAVSEAPADHAP